MPTRIRISPTAKVRLPPPVDLGRGAYAAILELQVGPEGSEDAEGHRDQKDQVPFHRRQQSSEHQADERA